MTFKLRMVDAAAAHLRATKGDKAFSEYLRDAPEHRAALSHANRLFQQQPDYKEKRQTLMDEALQKFCLTTPPFKATTYTEGA